MDIDDELASWLHAQPLDQPVELDGESVWLKPGQDGAELGAFLIRSCTQTQLLDVLKNGFHAVTRFEAGLGMADDDSLVLTQWLPGATGWIDAAEALENLVNQLSMWRSLLGPRIQTVDAASSRNEERLRKLFLGALR